jgi:hypothetical protein
MQITIQHDVPLHPRQGGRGRKYPFNEMKVGDSFEVALGNGSGFTDISKLQSNLSNCARAVFGKGGAATRANPDRSAVRVWRLA